MIIFLVTHAFDTSLLSGGDPVTPSLIIYDPGFAKLCFMSGPVSILPSP